MTTITMTTLTCQTMIQGVVGSTSDACSVFLLILFACSYNVARESTSRLKHGRKFVGGNWSRTIFPLQYIKRLSPLWGLHRSERRLMRTNPLFNYIS